MRFNTERCPIGEMTGLGCARPTGIWDWNVASEDSLLDGFSAFPGGAGKRCNLFCSVELIHEADRDLFVGRVEAILEKEAKTCLRLSREFGCKGDWRMELVSHCGVVADPDGITRVAGSMINITPGSSWSRSSLNGPEAARRQCAPERVFQGPRFKVHTGQQVDNGTVQFERVVGRVIMISFARIRERSFVMNDRSWRAETHPWLR